ncbi:MAG: sigma-E processing peptidase SpoIIGA [Clostridia bacterium]|nr:sigma-E processing peptidase SpoIIGA [Clostridia bacterium]
MGVYIEYVLIDNFVIDYLMLKATFATTGIPCKRGRLFLCALFGAIIALIYPLLEFHTLILTSVKILSGLLIILIAYNYKTPKSYYINAVIFFGYTFLTGGIIIGVFNIFSLNYSSESAIAFMVIPAYAVIRTAVGVIKYIYRRKDVQCAVREIEITAFGVTQKGRGFVDTGNSLFDDDSPVIFCEKAFVRPFLSGDIKRIKFKKLGVGTVNGLAEKVAFKIDEIKIYNGTNLNIHNNVTVCIVNDIGEGYDVILHPALIRGNEYEIDRKIKKVS